MDTIRDIENFIILNWIELSGHEDGVYKFGDNGNEVSRLLKQAQELDGTGISTVIIFKTVFETYLKTQNYNLYDMNFGNEDLLRRLSIVRGLVEVLKTPWLNEKINEFKHSLKESIVNSEFKDEINLSILDDEYLGFIHIDTLCAMETLKEFQFSQGGEYDTDGRVFYNPIIRCYYNINSLVNVALSGPDGISLAMIKSEHEYFSFFVFAIKNQGTLTILTDKPSVPHPMFYEMSRKPERQYGERAFKLRFPYEFFNLDLEGYGHVDAKENNLVKYNKNGVYVSKLSAMNSDQILWVVMMFDLIKERYWIKKSRTKNLCYTGEMIIDNLALESVKNEVALRDYRPLSVDRLTSKEINSKSLKNDWQKKPCNFNSWIEEEFSQNVPEDVLNIVSDEVPKLLENKGIIRERQRGYISIARCSGGTDLIRTLSPTEFGSKEELERNRRWVARYNQVAVMKELMLNDYDDNYVKIIKWVMKRLFNNRTGLIEAAILEKFELPVNAVFRGETNGTFVNNKSENYSFSFSVIHGQRKPPVSHISNFNLTANEVILRFTSGVRYDKRKDLEKYTDGNFLRRCSSINPQKNPTTYIQIIPKDSRALALMLGVDFEKLPKPLQAWRESERFYIGNSILNNLDPLEWKLKNPWNDHTFGILIGMTKSEYKKLSRELNK